MKRYAELFKTPGLARIVASQLVARFQNGMITLAVLIHVQAATGRYAIAGLVLAAIAIGQAFSGPVSTRWMAKHGVRPVILLMAIVAAISLTALAILPVHPASAIALALLGGFALPPVQPAVRATYPTIVTGSKLQSLQSFDAAIQEVIWVAGPVIAVFVATQVSPPAAILSAVGIMTLGLSWFLTAPAIRDIRLQPSTGKMGAVLKYPAVLIMVAAGTLLVASFAAIEAATVAVFGNESAESGWVLAIWAGASLIGGLALGHRPIGRFSIVYRIGIVAAGAALVTVSLTFGWMIFALVLSGFGVAPALTVMYAVVTHEVKGGDLAESIGWLGTGHVLGAAMGSAIAGFLIDAFGPYGAFWGGAAIAALGAIIPLVWSRFLPDLRHLATHTGAIDVVKE
ncbi:putative MFS family arabinose efflux permease [Microbacteriaceae bacterium MWH-Ta3]|nr:putative MFS family arabinose efflux permease [Microbacteriaceae bacterium MWH-Ta3]